MGEGNSNWSVRAKIEKWEQMAIQQDCVLTRNCHQVLEDENLAKQLQKEFDEELARETASRPQAMDSGDFEIQSSGRTPAIQHRHRVEINVRLSQDSGGRVRLSRDPSLDYAVTFSTVPEFRDDPSRLVQPTRDPPLDYDGTRRRRAQPPRDPSLEYEVLHEIAERLGEARHPGLRQSEIDLLPNRRFQPTDVPKDNSDTRTCHICLFNWKRGDSIKSLPCFHDFHAKCINNWLKINKSCPICRLEVKLSNH